MKEILFRKESTYSLRGICMILIVLHHIYQYTASRYGVVYPMPMPIIFQSFGYLATGVFFLLSGYGLSFSMKKNEPIALHYVITQMVKLYKPFLLVWGVSSLLDILVFKENGINRLLLNATSLSLTGGGSFWFLKEIFFIYLFTLLVYAFIRNDNLRQSVVWVGIIAFIVVGKIYGLGYQWLNSIICFPLGINCYYRKNILEKYNITLNGLFLICLFVISSIGRYAVEQTSLDNGILLSIIELLLQIVSSVSLALYSIRFITIANVKNCILSYIGTNSLCIYLYHLYFLSVFSFQKNIWFYLLAVIVCTFLLTMLYERLDKRLSKACKNHN